MYYTYVIKSRKNERLYFGSTKDLNRRLIEHNRGKNISTRYHKPWDLVYFEKFTVRSLAVKREKFFKSGKGREYIKEKISSLHRGVAQLG